MKLEPVNENQEEVFVTFEDAIDHLKKVKAKVPSVLEEFQKIGKTYITNIDSFIGEVLKVIEEYKDKENINPEEFVRTLTDMDTLEKDQSEQALVDFLNGLSTTLLGFQFSILQAIENSGGR